MASGLKIAWSIEGEKQLSRVLRGIQLEQGELKKPLESAAKELTSIFEGDVFSTRGSIINTTWKPLSPYTLATKARQGYPPDPLVATGAMQRSFKYIVSSDQAVVTNTAEYFKYHQSNKPRRKIPRRVMMRLGNNQREMIIKQFQEYFRAKMKK